MNILDNIYFHSISQQFIEPEILALYRNMKQELNQLQKSQDRAEQARQNRYMSAYLKLLQTMGKELVEAKLRYSQVDKQKMIDLKCQELADGITMFREEASATSEQLKKIKLQINQIRNKNISLEGQNQCLQQNVRRKQKSSFEQKSFFMTNCDYLTDGMRTIKQQGRSNKKTTINDAEYLNKKDEEFQNEFRKQISKTYTLGTRTRIQVSKKKFNIQQALPFDDSGFNNF